MKLNGREVVIDEVDACCFLRERNEGLYDEEVIVLSWSGNIGFGEYTLYTDSEGRWKADSECMDSNENKEFLKLLLNKFVHDLEVVS